MRMDKWHYFFEPSLKFGMKLHICFLISADIIMSERSCLVVAFPWSNPDGILKVLLHIISWWWWSLHDYKSWMYCKLSFAAKHRGSWWLKVFSLTNSQSLSLQTSSVVSWTLKICPSTSPERCCSRARFSRSSARTWSRSAWSCSPSWPRTRRTTRSSTTASPRIWK